MNKPFFYKWLKSTPIKILILIFILIISLNLIFNNYQEINLLQLNEMYDRDMLRCKRYGIKPAEKYSDVKVISEEREEMKDSIECFHAKGNSLTKISEINPRLGKSIFFHETSCKSYEAGKIKINPRQACAVESAARLNPNFDIYLLYSSPGVYRFQCEESDLSLEALLSYNNVKILHMNYENYIKNTPVESLYSSGKLDKSDFAIAHASDIVRYLTLWKYGGIYLDLDVIVLKSLENIKPNFAGVEHASEVAAGVLGFDATGNGHRWATSCLEDLKMRFTGKEWSDSSVGVITRFMESICGEKSVANMLGKKCEGYSLFPQEKFYAIPYWEWKMFFEEDKLEEVLNKTANSFAIHMWNKLSKNSKINVRASRVPYIYFAERYCPKVFKACDVFF